MPMKPHLYPVDWHEIAFAIKDACDWQCQACDLQCRRPDEPYDTQRRTLTVAHYDHIYDEPEIFVVALCAPCHLRHDLQHHLQQRRKNRHRHNMTLLLRQPAATTDDVAALAADWPEMPDLEGGVDLFAELYGPPIGEES